MAVHPKLQEKAQQASDDMDLFVMNNNEHENHEKLVSANTAVDDLANGMSPSLEDAKSLIELVPIPDHSREYPEEKEVTDESHIGLAANTATPLRSATSENEELTPLENLKATSRSFIESQASDEEGTEIKLKHAKEVFTEKVKNSIPEVEELVSDNPGLEGAKEAMEALAQGKAPTTQQAELLENLFDTMEKAKQEKESNSEEREFDDVPASVKRLVETSRTQIMLSARDGNKKSESISR